MVFSSVQTYQRNGVWADEFSFYTDSIKKSPGDIRPYISLANYYLKNNDIQSGLSTLLDAYEIKPDNIGVLACLFKIYTQLNIPDKYNFYYKKILDSIAEGNFKCSQNNFLDQTGKILYRKKRYGDVISVLEPIKKCRIKPAPYYGNLAECYYRIGNYGKAIENFRESVKLDPSNSYYLYSLTISYVQADDRENAIETFNLLLRSTPPPGLSPAVEELKNYFSDSL